MGEQAQRLADTEPEATENLETALLRLATEFINLRDSDTRGGIDRLLEFVGKFARADCCGVSRLVRSTWRLEPLHTWSQDPSTAASQLFSVDASEAAAIFGGQTEATLIDDVTTDDRTPGAFASGLQSLGVRSLAWFPIDGDDRQITAIGLTSSAARHWTDDDIALLRAAGRLVFHLRARAETALELQEATALLHDLSNSTDQHYFMWASSPPRFLFSSRAVERITGLERETLRKNPYAYLEVVLPEYHDSVLGLFSPGLHAAHEIEYRIRRNDGSIRWLRTRVFPENSTSSKEFRLAGITEDITERVGNQETGARFREFNDLLSSIADRFVETPVGAMAAAIEQSLADLASFAHVDAAWAYSLDANRERMTDIAHWQASPDSRIGEQLSAIPLSELPYFAAEAIAGRTIILSDVENLPEDASSEREFVRLAGARSCLIAPMNSSEGVAGALVLVTTSQHREWANPEINMLRAASELIASAVQRRQAETDLQDRIAFERVITSLMSNFMNVPAGEIDRAIDNALATVTEFVDCDRSGLYLLDADGCQATLVQAWWADGSATIVDDRNVITAEAGTMYGDWIRSDQPHLLFDVRDLVGMRPDAAAKLQDNQVTAFINLPLVIDGERAGWFTAGAREPRVAWSDAEVRCLSVAADALASMLSRRKMEQVQQRHQQLEDTLSALAADFIKRPLTELKPGIEEIVRDFARFANADRAGVLLFEPASGKLSTYYEWFRPGLGPAEVTAYPLETAGPALYEQLLRSTGPWLVQHDQVPESDREAAEFMRTIESETMLVCPVTDAGQVVGYSAVAYADGHARPPQGTEQIIAIATGIISNALTRQRLEEEAIEQRDSLARAARLGSLGELATGIAHELNQPLTAIASYSKACSNWLERADFDKDALGGMLSQVANEALRAGDIIHRLRSQVKGGSKHRSPTSVDTIIEHVSSLVAGTARDHEVEITADVPADLPTVDVDPTEIEQVLINLTQNAIESMTGVDPSDRSLSIAVRQEPSFVEIDVSDNGPGIKDSLRKQIFDQFYTTKKGGMGLGLPISKHLLEQNGSTIELVDDPTRGATFRIALPTTRRRKRPDSPA